MLRRALASRLFDGFFIQRWNDRVRPVDLTEIDKHAHKMCIAYCLGKYIEGEGREVNWKNVIEGGIFEYLRRIIISDIKSTIFAKIKGQAEIYSEFNDWVFMELEPCLVDLRNGFLQDFSSFLKDEYLDNTSKELLDAAHIYSSCWEFKIIQKVDPFDKDIDEIKNELEDKRSKYPNLNKMLDSKNTSRFIDRCGLLRFQIRWGQSPRLAKTSVLGHMFLVATFAYLLSHELDPFPCPKRIYNNYFCGLFHDLPEAVTRDIISPVKRSVGEMPRLIRKIEQEEAEEKLFAILDETWASELKYLTGIELPEDDEFRSRIKLEGKVVQKTSEEINSEYNEDCFCPLDAEIVKECDNFAAFLEAYSALYPALTSKHMLNGLKAITRGRQHKKIAGLNISTLYADFEQI